MPIEIIKSAASAAKALPHCGHFASEFDFTVPAMLSPKNGTKTDHPLQKREIRVHVRTKDVDRLLQLVLRDQFLEVEAACRFRKAPASFSNFAADELIAFV
jgi:hypothetical protein